MPTSTDFPARGKILRVAGNAVIFAPSNTTYELKLLTAVPYTGSIGTLVDVRVQLRARKLWTVASGGNFVTPIQGPTRIVQGRIKYLDSAVMVVQAGLPVMVQLPASDNQYDLNNGALAVGQLVNATILPGAAIEVIDNTGNTGGPIPSKDGGAMPAFATV
jgi:hypothetical protein